LICDLPSDHALLVPAQTCVLSFLLTSTQLNTCSKHHIKQSIILSISCKD